MTRLAAMSDKGSLLESYRDTYDIVFLGQARPCIVSLADWVSQCGMPSVS